MCITADMCFVEINGVGLVASLGCLLPPTKLEIEGQSHYHYKY